MKTDIWMPIYIGDYLKDTAHLTQGQHGAYFLLMMHYWQKGGLKSNIPQCYMIARATTEDEKENVKTVLAEFFYLVHEDKQYRQKRVELELIKAQERKEKATNKATKAANIRWNKNA